MPIATISTRHGRRDLSTTLGLYTHAEAATDQPAAAHLRNLLAENLPPAAEHR